MKKVIRFTATWCAPCKALKAVIDQIKTDIPIEVVDIDEQPDLATEFGIRSVPTLVMMEDNVATKRIIGLKSIQEVEAFIHD